MKKIARILLVVVIAFIIGFLGLIITATLSNYDPPEQTQLFSTDRPDIVSEWTELDLLTWNLGYCGLDSSMDFFYDGGTKVRPPLSHVEKSLDQAISFLKQLDTIEFILLQEVDIRSKRSYRINESDSLTNSLEHYRSFFALNYNVLFVPVPFTNPMGRVRSGIQLLSRYQPESSVRWSFPGNYGWPKNLFMLDRCFLVNRYKLSGGKQLLIIDTHNSAYDDGSLRKMQMNYLRRLLLAEYAKGNYIIVGGDWNQSPPDFTPSFQNDVFNEKDNFVIPDNYLPPDWTWAVDNTQPTNRSVAVKYKRGTTPTMVIDFYLLSPNVRLVSVQNHDLGFANSDHQPVTMKILLSN